MRKFTEGNPYLSGAAQFAPPEADYHEAVVLPANTIQVVAVPPGAAYVFPNFTGDFYWKFGGSNAVQAAIPATTTSDGSGSALNPTQRRVPDGVTHIALIAETACKGSLSFWM